MQIRGVVLITAAFVAAICDGARLTFPLKTTKDGNRLERVEINSCAGEDAVLVLNSASLQPDPVEYPGVVTIAMDVDVTQDLPEDMEITLDLTLLDIFPIEVPCLSGFGACTWKACDLVTDMAEVFCELLPVDENGVCSCPIQAGTYKSDALLFELPDLGDIFALLLQGDYEGKIKFHAGGNEADEYGCLDMSFTIIKP